MRRAMLLFALLIALPGALPAQSGPVVASPTAVELRRIWMIKGGPGAGVGKGSGGVGDINADGIDDFAVRSTIPWRWSIYLGSRDTAGPSTTPFWTFDSSSVLDRPVVGDFWGTGHKAVGFAREISHDFSYRFLYLFRTESGYLPDTPAVIWQAVRPDTPRVIPFGVKYIVADLDSDGADELIVVSPVVRHGTTTSYVGEIWIYKGGADFQVERPTVIVKGPKATDGQFYLFVADLDGDRYLDLITRSDFQQDSRVEIYFGRPQFFSSTQRPNREVSLARPFVMDVDGDDRGDIIAGSLQIYRSGTGKNMRTRFYEADDIDDTLTGGPTMPAMFDLGHLNSKRYRMLGVDFNATLLGFSTSPTGIDGDYEAFTAGGTMISSNPFRVVSPAGDVNGDGWDDLIVSTDAYPDQGLDNGIAMVFAGGPYISNEDPTLAVPAAPAEPEIGLRIWPNPASGAVVLQWPEAALSASGTIEIRDVLGRQIAVLDAGRDGRVLWDATHLAGGIYLVGLYNAGHHLIGMVRFLKL